MEEIFGIFAGVIYLFFLIVAILAFLLPFFVLRIRNELIATNKKLTTVIQLLGGHENFQNHQENEIKKKAKICSHCGTKNMEEEYICIKCKQPLV